MKDGRGIPKEILGRFGKEKKINKMFLNFNVQAKFEQDGKLSRLMLMSFDTRHT